MFEYSVSRWWTCLGRIGRCGFVGGGVLLAGGFGISKSQANPSYSFLPCDEDQDVGCPRLLRAHSCLPAAMSLAMVVMASNVL